MTRPALLEVAGWRSTAVLVAFLVTVAPVVVDVLWP